MVQESEISVKKVVDFAMEAGQVLLKNGGEIFRVEETIVRICNHFNIHKVDIFTLGNGIFVSAENDSGETYTKVKHIPLSSAHLEIVAQINDLSRHITAGSVTLDEADKRLQEIEKIPKKKSYHQILAAGVVSGTLGYLLGASLKEGMITFWIGCILYIWVLIAQKYKISKLIVNIVGGVIITTLAIFMQWLPFTGHIAVENMIIGAVMPLVPGLSFVNAIRDVADGDFLSGTVRIIDALMVFVYIAIGVGLSFSIFYSGVGGVVF